MSAAIAGCELLDACEVRSDTPAHRNATRSIRESEPPEAPVPAPVGWRSVTWDCGRCGASHVDLFTTCRECGRRYATGESPMKVLHAPEAK